MQRKIRPIARLAWNVATAVSAIIVLTVTVTWARSCWRVDEVAGVHNGGTTSWTLRSMDGEYLLVVYRNLRLGTMSSAGSPPASGLSAKVWARSDLRAIFIEPRRGLGAAKDLLSLPFTDQGIWVGIAHWMVLLVAMPLPLLWGYGRLRAVRRGARGGCPVCGYDLRATPDRCPECGTIAPRETPHNPPMHRTGPAV